VPNEFHPKVAVVIPTWKRDDLLRQCLQALRRQSFADTEIVIVANGAGEWAERLAREFDCRLVRLPKNRGFAAGVNAGIAGSKSEYVAVLNDDVELRSDWLERLAGLLDQRKDLSFCCGKILQADGRTIDNAGDALSLGGGAWRLGYGRPDGPEFDQPRQLFAVSGTAALFRREVFDKLGGFDEDFVSYLEDMDLSIRMWRAGLRGWYLPQAVALHHGGSSSKTAGSGGAQPPFVFEQITRNQLSLFAKYYPLPLLLRLSPRILWAQFLWAGMALRQHRMRPYVRGLWGFAGKFPALRRRRHKQTKELRHALLTQLRKSDADIFEDTFFRPAAERNSYWRSYFTLFPVSTAWKNRLHTHPDGVSGHAPQEKLTTNR
jgi:GT2 family glycosyltransferase